MGMANLCNGLCHFRIVCQLSAGGIGALGAGLDLAPTHLDTMRIWCGMRAQ